MWSLGTLGYRYSLAAEILRLSLPLREQRGVRRLSSARSRDLPPPLQDGVSADLGVQLLCRPSPRPAYCALIALVRDGAALGPGPAGRTAMSRCQLGDSGSHSAGCVHGRDDLRGRGHVSPRLAVPGARCGPSHHGGAERRLPTVLRGVRDRLQLTAKGSLKPFQSRRVPPRSGLPNFHLSLCFT